MSWIRWLFGLFLSFYIIDIDYLVFSDASKFIWNGASPYDRSTYRYTPLLALLLLPTVTFPLFGKWLFLACDHLGAFILKKILILNKEPEWIADIYLWNPFMMAISARGSSESLLLLLVLWTFLLVQEEKIVWAGILFGLSVHLKLYPIIYAWPYCLFLAGKCSLYSLVTSRKVWLFACVSALTFVSLFSLMYQWYGHAFVHETYLYHFIRKDHRHNFSPYFYGVYLSFMNASTAFWTRRFAFLPQLILIVYYGWKYALKDLSMALFCQTFSFVMMNKVSTSQYFMWYLCFIPLIAHRHEWFGNQWKSGVFATVLWVIGQAIWIYYADLLENQGKQVYRLLWASSIGFYLINVYVLHSFEKGWRFVDKKKYN